jgi:hypothetical protein
MNLIRCGKQMLNLFGRLSETSDTQHLNKTAFIRFFQMLSTMKRIVKPQSGGSNDKEELNEKLLSKTKSETILPYRLTTTELSTLYERIVMGNNVNPPKAGRTKTEGDGDDIQKTANNGKGSSKNTFERKTKKSVLKNKNTLSKMTFPDFCRALIEIACLKRSSQKKGKNKDTTSNINANSPTEETRKVDAVQELLLNVELLSSNAEKMINLNKSPKRSRRGSTDAAKNKGKPSMERRHSLGYLLTLSQKIEKEKERRQQEKLELKNKEKEMKERQIRGEEARKRVIDGLRKRKKEKLAKEKAFYAEIEKEKEKERRKSEFTNWMTKRSGNSTEDVPTKKPSKTTKNKGKE